MVIAMQLKPKELGEVEFSLFGWRLSVPAGKPPVLDTGYSKCWSAEYTLPLGEMRFGVEQVEYRRTLAIEKLEQHKYSKEVVICGDKPVVLCLCPPRREAGDGDRPRCRDAVAVILRPGDVVVLNEYVWHSGCMPLEEDTFYHFAYRVRDEALDWYALEDGPIELDLEAWRGEA